MNAPNPYAPPQATVADIEMPGIVRARRLTRLLAALLDGFIASLLIEGPLLMSISLRDLITPSRQIDPGVAMTMLLKGGPYALLGLLVWAVITYILVQRNGQTIAKKLLGIKVARVDGSRASVARIFWLRNVVNTLITIVPFFGLLYALLDALWIFGAERRCLHDRIADTIVVNA